MSTEFTIFDRSKKSSLKASSTVMVLVDFINPMQFPGSENLLQGASQAAHATARLKRKLSQQGVAAIYANDNYGIWRSEFKDLLAACQALPGIRGEIASLLAPDECDLTLLKPLHSAFVSTPLEHLLKELKARELVVVGLSTDMCVHFTAIDAYTLGYKVWVPRDCTAAESQERKDSAL